MFVFNQVRGGGDFLVTKLFQELGTNITKKDQNSCKRRKKSRKKVQNSRKRNKTQKKEQHLRKKAQNSQSLDIPTAGYPISTVQYIYFKLKVAKL